MVETTKMIIVSKSLHKELKKMAAEKEISIKAFVDKILKEKIDLPEGDINDNSSKK